MSRNRFSLASALCGLLLSLPAWAGREIRIPKSNTEYGPFTIQIEIEDVTLGVFQSVEGLASVSEGVPTEEYGVPVEAPGAIKSPHLILRRQYNPLLTGLWRWRQAVLDGNPQKRDGHIYIFAVGGNLVAHWVFHKGWPCRWEVPKLVAGSTEPAEEILEIAHEGLTQVEPGL
jgi:phage tail-like protein